MNVGSIAFVVDTFYEDKNKLTKEVLEEIREAWASFEVGNNWYYLPATYLTEEDDPEQYPHFKKWFYENFEDGDNVLIYHWW